LFDPLTQKISVEKDLHIKELYDLTFEAFHHVNLLPYQFPFAKIRSGGVTYYICSWEVMGAQVLEDDEHKFIEGVLADD
jgi:hypothetical protein